MVKESRVRKRNLRIPLALLLAAFCFQLASADALAQVNNTDSFLSRLSSRISNNLKASFTYSPKFPKEGQPVQFVESSSGASTSWTWDFGDGTTSTERNPFHVYSSSGFRKVTLTVAASANSKRASRTVAILPGTEGATFVFSPTTPSPGQTVQFADTTSGTPTSWQWNFGDGGTSSAKNPGYKYSRPGTFTVTLMTSGSSGTKQGTRSITVAEMSVLVASFTYTPSAPMTGQSIQFTDTSTGSPTSWLWNFGDGGTSTAQNPNHTYSMAGSKTVTLIVTNSSGSNSTSRTFAVLAALTASFGYNPASPSVGQSVQFTDTSTGTPSIWQWNFGDGATSVAQNPTHSFASAGPYTVTLTIMNASASNTTSRAVVVGTILTASFTYSPASPVAGQSIQFTDTSAGSPTSWLWNFGDGTTSALRNPSHAYLTSGSNIVSLTAATSSNSHTTSMLITVTPTGTLQASFSFSPYSPAPGQAIAFRDSSTGTPTSLQWNFGDGGTSTVQNPSHSYASEGSYIVTLIASNSSGSDTVSRTVTVAESPDIIPADRLYDWGAYCGVPGGIPNRTTIYRTLTPSNTAAEINAAIAACPAGQVVYLAAGTYNVSGLTMKSGVTMRGAGAGQTIVNSGTGRAFASPEVAFSYSTSGKQAIANGAWLVKGSTSITMATTPGAQFAVGRLILIDQEDDNTLVFHRPGNWAGTRNLRHVSRITGITGNTITFATPLPYTYVAAQNPMAQAIVPTYLFGVEDMTIRAYSCVHFQGTDRCWVKNCELTNFENEAIFLRDSHQVEIRRCYIHDAYNFPNQSDGYGIYAQYAVSCVLAEDNIGYRMSYMMIMNGNDSSAFLYNYILYMARAGFPWQSPGLNCNHGPHCIMNLWEGNIAERWQSDSYHGSASHQTLFRNHIHGVNPAYTLNRRIMDFCRASYYFNAVGNIIGDSSWNPAYYEASKTTGTGYWNSTLDRSVGYMWVLGYPNMEGASLTEEGTLAYFTPPGGTYPDSNVAATLFRHANFDYYNKATVYQSGVSQAIPPSLYYASKPSYFGSLQWPPIGPDVSGLITDIPAQARWSAYMNSGRLNDLFR